MSLHPTIFADMATGPEVWIRVEGKGTFQNSPAVKEFAKRMLDEGRRQLVVDLKNCPSMDSTFMGTLAGVAMRLREAGDGDLWVVNRNERNAELLAGLGLDGLFSDKPVPVQSPAGNGQAVHHPGDKSSTRDAMHEAHAVCIAVDPRNEEKFKDVIEHLKASAAKAASS
jgi:anti-anti-sigma factor